MSNHYYQKSTNYLIVCYREFQNRKTILYVCLPYLSYHRYFDCNVFAGLGNGTLAIFDPQNPGMGITLINVSVYDLCDCVGGVFLSSVWTSSQYSCGERSRGPVCASHGGPVGGL